MIDIAVLGMGVVGGGVAELVEANAELIHRAVGDTFRVKYVLDKRDFPGHPLESRIVRDINVILSDPDVRIVAEMMGGSHPAFEFSLAALNAGKSVVTSNKEVVSTYGPQLLEAAERNGVFYAFEASVGGGIPIIRPLMTCLRGERIRSVYGIFNGTTNYILTRMFTDGVSFEAALAEAQKLGYAEADPSADVDGIDTQRKTCILSALAFGVHVPPSSIHTQTVRTITGTDVEAAEYFGASVKLVGCTRRLENGRILSFVAPCFVRHSSPLCHIDDVFNGVCVEGEAFDQLLFRGKGAGRYPTAASVLADMINLVSNSRLELPHPWREAAADEIADFDELVAEQYLRVTCADAEAVLARVGPVLAHRPTSTGVEFLLSATSERDAVLLEERLSGNGTVVQSRIRVL